MLIMLIPQVLAKGVASAPDLTIVEATTTQPIHTPEPRPLSEYTPQELVVYYADLYGTDAELAREIIRCESGWNRTADNPNSTAYSYFQFLDRTWYWTLERMGLPIDTPKDHPIISIQAGVWLLATDGSRHWNESKHCWNKSGKW